MPNDLQQQLESLLGFDADTEIEQRYDYTEDRPAPGAWLTETAALRVIELLRKGTDVDVEIARRAEELER